MRPANPRTDHVDGPAIEPVTIAEMMRHLREEQTDEQVDIAGLIREAREFCETQLEASLIETRWSLFLDRFPSGSKRLQLPRWPLLQLESVAFVAPDGAEVPIDVATLHTYSSQSDRAMIARRNFEAWPATAVTPGAVEITYTAGFGTAAADVPGLWKRAIKLLAAHWYEQREAVIVGAGARELPLGFDRVIELLRPEDFGECEPI